MAGAPPSLDHRTQLVDALVGHHARLAPYVVTTLYPGCGEAVVCQVFPRPPLDPEAAVLPPVAVDPEVAWQRANIRARSRSRRYIVGNRLRFMVVLTFAGEGLHGAEGRAAVMAEVAQMVRRMRAEVGDFPYWYSPELHPGGHGWHCNLFLGQRLAHADLTRWWAHGHVWAKDWTRDTRVKAATFVERLRAGATYGAKYAAKDWDAVQLAGGAHRYEVAQGYEPVAVIAEVRSVAAGIALARSYLGGSVREWRSSTDDDWHGPECAVVFAGTQRGRRTTGQGPPLGQ